ncbi:DNA pol B 2 domain-containing protein, partial [Aphis craccivora]
MRYAKANNYKAPDFDPTKPNSWLIYQDCNNLYGWAMSQYMPYGGFKWVEPNLKGLFDLTDTSLSVEYMKLTVPVGSKVTKLMATFESKKNYIVHCRSLQQAIKNGLIVNK